MKTLVKRSLYKELRSSVGYYDARRIVRCVGDKELSDVGLALKNAGFDERQVALAVEAAGKLLAVSEAASN